MKKIISALLATVMVASTMTYVSAVTTTAKLVRVEDFESCAVGTYTEGEIVDLGPKLGYVNVAGGSVLEICQESDGNKYLKATVPEYAAFGYYFGSGSDRKYAYMTFDYKFPTAGGNANFASYAHTGAKSGSPSFLNGENSWGISSYSTDKNVTEWTQATGKNYTNAYSACMGIAPVQGGGNRIIYVDNIIVWEFNDTVGVTHNSSVASTVTFENSTGNEGEITMPNPYTGIAWCNLYNAQSSNCTINLNNYVPTGAPYGKKFLGWSLTDGGNVIKSTMYNAFKIPGNITLYAVWDSNDVVVKKEDFEGFAENQVLTSADLEFIYLNNFGVENFVATVKKDAVTGNKYLRIDTVRFGGIQVKNRNKEAGAEYWKLNYRYLQATGSRFVVYAGSDHTGGNQGSGFARKTEWTNIIQSADAGKAVLGAFFDAADGNYSIELDDMYYWFVPEDVTKEVVTTFANSTQKAPANPILPEAVVKYIWTAPESDENTIALNKLSASDPNGEFTFMGWSRTDGGKVINAVEDVYRCVCNETLYAIWEKIEGPTVCDEIELQQGSGYQGIRFKAFVTEAQREIADEYGFIVTRKENLSEGELTFNLKISDKSKRPFLTGIAYKKSTGVDNVWEDSSDRIYFTILLTDITAERGSDVYVARPYLKLGNDVFYGDCKEASWSQLQ